MGCKRLTYQKNETLLKVIQGKKLFFVSAGEEKKPYRTKNCLNAYKYKYNGKELQDEFGLNMYDYGARFYDPAVPGFWQIDPLAEDYNFQTPYAYAINNPVYFIDKDGMAPDWIVGKDKNVNNGRATYKKNSDGSITWTNASADTQRIGNAMMSTDYGTKQFNKWMTSSTKVNHKYKKGSKSGAHAKTKPKKVGGKLLDKNGHYLEVNVVFYENAIDDALSDGGRYDGATKEEVEGSVGSHEVDHLDAEQIKLDKATNTNEELQSPSKNKPFNSEVKFRREYHKKYPNKGKKNWEEPYKKRGYEGNN